MQLPSSQLYPWWYDSNTQPLRQMVNQPFFVKPAGDTHPACLSFIQRTHGENVLMNVVRSWNHKSTRTRAFPNWMQLYPRLILWQFSNSPSIGYNLPLTCNYNIVERELLNCLIVFVIQEIVVLHACANHVIYTHVHAHVHMYDAYYNSVDRVSRTYHK